jgi:hypothetical protein
MPFEVDQPSVAVVLVTWRIVVVRMSGPVPLAAVVRVPSAETAAPPAAVMLRTRKRYVVPGTRPVSTTRCACSSDESTIDLEASSAATPYSTCDEAGASVCQAIVALDRVRLLVSMLEIAGDAGVAVTVEVGLAVGRSVGGAVGVRLLVAVTVAVVARVGVRVAVAVHVGAAVRVGVGVPGVSVAVGL